VRGLEYPLLGKTVRVTDDVDISLVKPRPRKYETAGAANQTVNDVPVKEPKDPAKPAVRSATPG
jgi:hypothetical protein